MTVDAAPPYRHRFPLMPCYHPARRSPHPAGGDAPEGGTGEMFAGVALAEKDIPEDLIGRHGLARRVYHRGGEREFQFLLRDGDRVLPMWLGGRLQIARWGTRRGQGGRLPLTAWTWLETFESGGWKELGAEPVVIPATMALDRGGWFLVTEGVREVAVRDERGRPAVYVLVEPSTHYYQVMTRSEWMPPLVGELI